MPSCSLAETKSRKCCRVHCASSLKNRLASFLYVVQCIPLGLGGRPSPTAPGSSQPDVQALGAAKSTIVRLLALTIVGELMAGPAGEYLAAIENSNSSPTSSRRTQKPLSHSPKMTWCLSQQNRVFLCFASLPIYYCVCTTARYERVPSVFECLRMTCRLMSIASRNSCQTPGIASADCPLCSVKGADSPAIETLETLGTY